MPPRQGRRIVRENPYDASEPVTDGHHSVIPMTITWPRIWLAGLITVVTMVVVFTTLVRHDAVLSMQFEMAEDISVFLVSNTAADWQKLSAALLYSVMIGMPYVLLTLLVFVSLLRFLCRNKSRQSETQKSGIPESVTNPHTTLSTAGSR